MAPKNRFFNKSKILADSIYSLNENTYLNFKEIKSDFPINNLGDICSVKNGYAFKSSEMTNMKQQDQLPVLKIGNISFQGNLDISKIQFHDVNDQTKNFIVSSGDFVVAMTGATVGKVAIIESGEFLLNQRVGCIRVNSEVERDYIKFLLISEKFYNYCQHGAEGGAQGNISSTGIENYKIPLPPIEVQQEIVDELEGYQIIIV